ncbi:hypothetical protein ES706_01426 [subsurface metagenome]
MNVSKVPLVILGIAIGVSWLVGYMMIDQGLEKYNELVDSHNELIADHNELVADYNELREQYNMMTAAFDELTADHNKLVADRDKLKEQYNMMTAAFDCDDATLNTYHYFTDKGYPCKIYAGNLELENERFDQCNHVWLLVDVNKDGQYVAYDWGQPQYDAQHYFGYEQTYKQLVKAMKADW